MSKLLKTQNSTLSSWYNYFDLYRLIQYRQKKLEKVGDADEKIQYTNGLVTTTVLQLQIQLQKLVKLRTKLLMMLNISLHLNLIG